MGAEWGEGSGQLGFVSPVLLQLRTRGWPCPAWRGTAAARGAPSRNPAQTPPPGPRRSTTVHPELRTGAGHSPPCGSPLERGEFLSSAEPGARSGQDTHGRPLTFLPPLQAYGLQQRCPVVLWPPEAGRPGDDPRWAAFLSRLQGPGRPGLPRQSPSSSRVRAGRGRGGHRQGQTLPGRPHVLGGPRASLPQPASRLPRLPGRALPSETRAVPSSGVPSLRATGCGPGGGGTRHMGARSPQGPAGSGQQKEKERRTGSPQETEAPHRAAGRQGHASLCPPIHLLLPHPWCLCRQGAGLHSPRPRDAGRRGIPGRRLAVPKVVGSDSLTPSPPGTSVPRSAWARLPPPGPARRCRRAQGPGPREGPHYRLSVCSGQKREL